MEAYNKGLTINGYDSPYHFMKEQMKIHPALLQQIAMVQDITVTYAEMMQTVDKVAAFLHDEAAEKSTVYLIGILILALKMALYQFFKFKSL